MKVRIASAGTGKTTSLVLRYLELLATYPPQRVGVVTYTRLATAELRDRIRGALEQIARSEPFLDFEAPGALQNHAERYARQVLEAPIRTIHGFFADLLRLAAPHLSLDPEFAVLDPGAAAALFHESAQTAAFLQGIERPPIAEAELLFSKRPLAGELMPTGEVSAELHRFYQAALEEYLKRTAGRQLGPADIELLALRLTSLPEDLLRRVAARYPVVLVDEAQDTSPLQSKVFATLEEMGVEIEIVGDPKQSIYGFRDADPEGFRRAAKSGEVLKPLTTSRRHSASIARLLNSFTTQLSGEDHPPFLPEEAPWVDTVRTGVAGSTSLLVIRGLNYEKLDQLRRAEANALAARLVELVERGGYRWSDVFVLTRSHGPTGLLKETFERWGIPYVVIGSRGLYALPEIRDLYHALAAALAPRKKRDSLAAFLTGPFAMLDTEAATRVLASDDPLARLEGVAPEVHERLLRIREWTTTLAPEDSLVRLTREPMLAGASYYDLLEPEQREHVDYVIARLRTAQTYPQVLYLLETLKAYDTEEGSFPTGAGDAVEIMTVHGAKGREAPIVAVFNAGAQFRHRSQPLYVEPFTGRYAVKGDEDYEELKKRQRERERHEEDRLLYVALSRARDHLLVTASLNWPEDKKPYRWEGTWVHTLLERIQHPRKAFDGVEVLTPDEVPAPAKVPQTDEAHRRPEPDPRLLEALTPGPWPVYSPSALKSERRDTPDEAEAVPQDPETSLFARIVGILTHAGIALSWHPDHVDLEELLQGEEVTHEIPPERHGELAERVGAHLRTYWSLIEEGAIPAPDVRDEDFAEYPVAFPLGGTVWEGVIDRVYRVGKTWYLEDYKTDREVRPERYFAQLALYRKALAELWGIEPQARLVFLTAGRVITLSEEDLEWGLGELRLEPALPQ